jgi:heptosyltransferase I
MPNAQQSGPRILVVRLGAMGDIIHALPAAASLRDAFPGCRLTWIVEPRWAPLLAGNPTVDRIVPLRRGTLGGLLRSWRELRSEACDVAVDFQGLLKSALTARAAGPQRIFGFHRSQARERAAALLYTDEIRATAAHVVDRNLELAAAAGAGVLRKIFPLPPGEKAAGVPEGPFVLASPFAGWRAKQWPLEHYAELARRLRAELGMPLVLDTPKDMELEPVPDAVPLSSTLAGLIDTTRRAAAVVGVDSGPMHLAAALGKRGVALFGPTDPARNGPYGGSLTVLRSALAATTYKRGAEIDPSMRAISPGQVFAALECLAR